MPLHQNINHITTLCFSVGKCIFLLYQFPSDYQVERHSYFGKSGCETCALAQVDHFLFRTEGLASAMVPITRPPIVPPEKEGLQSSKAGESRKMRGGMFVYQKNPPRVYPAKRGGREIFRKICNIFIEALVELMFIQLLGR